MRYPLPEALYLLLAREALGQATAQDCLDWTYAMTFLLLLMLRDEDLQAFPQMHCNTYHRLKADASLGRSIQLTNQLPLSDWGNV